MIAKTSQVRTVSMLYIILSGIKLGCVINFSIEVCSTQNSNRGHQHIPLQCFQTVAYIL